MCALTGHIAREARRLAATAPGGRLDPPLTLALDEAALISPVPLESWTADMGGRGVTILAAFQSRAQLLARWGEHNTATILNNTSAVMVFGGTRDRDDLQFWSTLAGERDEPILTTDLHGRVASRTTRRVPVLAPSQIANLPTGRVVVIRRGIGPVIGRAQMVWRRRDVRARHRAIARVERYAEWCRRVDEARALRDALIERALIRLAERWPERFGEASARVRNANAMFAELRRIQAHPTPHLVPIVGPPGSLAAITAEGAEIGYQAIVGPTFRNEMCARGIMFIPLNRPVTSASKLRCPLLVVLAERDNIAPTKSVRAAAKKAGRLAQVLVLPSGHFDIYAGEMFEKSVSAQVDFLMTHVPARHRQRAAG